MLRTTLNRISVLFLILTAAILVIVGCAPPSESDESAVVSNGNEAATDVVAAADEAVETVEPLPTETQLPPTATVAPAEPTNTPEATRAFTPRLPILQPAPNITNEVWINTEPLTLEELRGKVVLIEFWTFG